MELEKVLNLPMLEDNDAEADTIRDYLHSLLKTLWSEGEGFSGKRPFGNSGWEHDLYVALVKGGAIAGKFDEEYDDLLDYDEKEADKLIYKVIEYVFHGKE